MNYEAFWGAFLGSIAFWIMLGLFALIASWLSKLFELFTIKTMGLETIIAMINESKKEIKDPESRNKGAV